jgi:hypothetical protein
VINVEGTYVVPRGKGDGDPILLDIKAVVTAEQRLQEVAFVTREKAPELLATYNQHWLTLNDAVTMLTFERNEADGAVKDAYSEALLDVNDEALKKRGHAKGSQDLREALATLDPRHKEARARLNEIKAVLSYVEGKRKAFEHAYQSVKKLVDEGKLPERPLHAPTELARKSAARFSAPMDFSKVDTGLYDDPMLDDLPGFVPPKPQGYR